MKKYYYKARMQDGKIIEGIIKAASRFEVYDFLAKKRAVAIEVKKSGPSKFSFSYWNEKLSTIKEIDKISFVLSLATMLEAGLSVTRSLEVARKQIKNPKLKMIIREIINMIESGFSLNSALSKYKNVFPPIFIAMVKAGERSGNLPQSLRLIGEQMKSMYELKRKIKGAMIYPSIVIFAIFGIGIFMMVYVVPRLVKTLKQLNVELPQSTKLMIAISEFIKNYYIFIAIFIVLFPVIVLKLRRHKKTRFLFDYLFLKIPVISTIYKQINCAYFSRTLASLLRSGVHLTEAIEITSDVLQNVFYKKALKDMLDSVKKGSLISDVLKKYPNLFPTLLIEMVAVGEETGKISDMLENTAKFYEKSVSEKTKNLSTIIEPLLMLLVGVAVGFFAVSMIGPIYSVTDAF